MPARPKTTPLVRSSAILRGLATALTLTSLTGMTAFASTHVQNSSAPLQPAASSTTTSATVAATPAPTANRTTTTTRNRRTTVTSGVGTTTTTPARTRTAQS